MIEPGTPRAARAVLDCLLALSAAAIAMALGAILAVSGIVW